MIGIMEAYRRARKKYLKHGYSRSLKRYLTFFNLMYGCSISAKCEIGDGTELGYGGIGIVIHEKCKIGKNCVISQNVTLGGRDSIPGEKERKKHFIDGEEVVVPVIGDNVKIGAGAVLLGGIIIGDNCVIGANSVVVDDVPADSIVAGVPGRVLRKIERGNDEKI